VEDLLVFQGIFVYQKVPKLKQIEIKSKININILIIIKLKITFGVLRSIKDFFGGAGEIFSSSECNCLDSSSLSSLFFSEDLSDDVNEGWEVKSFGGDPVGDNGG
jgi:hypothetical protein